MGVGRGKENDMMLIISKYIVSLYKNGLLTHTKTFKIVGGKGWKKNEQ
jgi:hypothetical protein